MKISILTDDIGITSGYGVLGKAFSIALQKLGHEVSYLSFQHVAGPKRDAETGIMVYAGDNDVSRKRSIDKIDPEMIIHIRDLTAHSKIFYSAAYSLSQFRREGRIVAGYVMVQSNPLPFEFADAVKENYDMVIVPTEWSKRRLVEVGVPWNWIHVIQPATLNEYKGNITKEYFGLDQTKETIVSIGVHDQLRKNWIGLLYAFKLVKNKNSELFLNTASGAFYIENLIRHFGLKGRVIMPLVINKAWGSDELPGIYRIADCYLSMSTAEGINMPLVESVMNGLPVVASAHPNQVELLKDIAFFVKTAQIMPSSWSFEYLPDPADAADKVDEVLSWGRKEREEYREKAMEYSKVFTVTSLAERLAKII